MSEDKIKSIIIDKLGIEGSKITRDADLINDLGADSLDQVELVMQLEEEFNIEISDMEAGEIPTVGEAVNFIESRMVN